MSDKKIQADPECPTKEKKLPAVDTSIEAVVNTMKKDKTRVWTSVEQHEMYCETEHSEHVLLRHQFVNNLLHYIGNDVLEMKSQGCA